MRPSASGGAARHPQTSPGLPVCLSYGGGVDSTAILLRFLTDPAGCGLDLEALTVVHAVVGNEFGATYDLVESEILPRLREAGVRYVQLARGGPRTADGVAVLDDSRSAPMQFRRGPWRLSDELRLAGTSPQVARGRRLCSCRFKGEPIDRFCGDLYRGTRYRHVLGFAADETQRALRDQSYTAMARDPWYPLIEWGWDRCRSLAFIAEVTGVDDWPKSACTFCPFSAGRSTLPIHLDRYRAEPAAGVEALSIEHTARALNPRMTLYGSTSLRSLLEGDGQAHVLGLFEDQLTRAPQAVYHVRRILDARANDPTKKGIGWRSVRTRFVGSPERSRRELDRLAAAQGSWVTVEDGVARVWSRLPGANYPTTEEFLVVAPAGVADKERPGFAAKWSEVTGEGRLFGRWTA